LGLEPASREVEVPALDLGVEKKAKRIRIYGRCPGGRPLAGNFAGTHAESTNEVFVDRLHFAAPIGR
jgi:hypothetical protein